MNIKPMSECAFDQISLGEVMLRLDPGQGRIKSTRTFDAWEGGGEYNVARGLRRCFGLRTAVVTAFAENDIGRLVEDLIFQGGVDTRFIQWKKYDGIGRTTRNGLNFTERGFGLRGAVGVSDRGNTAASQLTSTSIDWDAIFSQGVRWFHTGGIYAGLSETTPGVIEAAMKYTERWKNLKEEGVSDEEIKKTFYKSVKMKIFAWNSKRELDTTMTPFDSIRYHKQLMQTSFVAMDPHSGEVKCWAGGIDFKWFKFDHVTAERQVGSTFKPLVYSLAVMDAGYTPETQIPGGARYRLQLRLPCRQWPALCPSDSAPHHAPGSAVAFTRIPPEPGRSHQEPRLLRQPLPQCIDPDSARQPQSYRYNAGARSGV